MSKWKTWFKAAAIRAIRTIAMSKWKTWFKAAAIRAIRTIAQTAVAMIGTSVAIGDVDWMLVGSASLLAGILSLLTSVATGLPEVDEEEELEHEELEETEPEQGEEV